MKIFSADHETKYDVPGVSEPVRKPVNLGEVETGFTRLRSLRIYQFDQGSTIDGHAEEDEVFVVVTAGSVEMRIGYSDDAVEGFGTFSLSAPPVASESIARDPFAAYLPPHSVYRMVPKTNADVLYARASGSQARQPAVFHTQHEAPRGAVRILLNEATHAQHLRLVVARINAETESSDLVLATDDADKQETLLHVQGGASDARTVGTVTAGAESLPLCSWDTVAISSSDPALLHVSRGGSVLVVAISAT